MTECGLVGVHGRRKWRRGKANTAPASDLLQGDFTAEASDHKWVADITEFACWDGKLDFLDSPRGRARVGSSSLPGPALVTGAREGMVIAPQSVLALMVQLVNHTDVVSVEDLEALISEARHLASEEDTGTVHADLGGNLARTTGSGGEAT